MGALEAPIHRARVWGRKRVIGAPTRAGWMGGLNPPMTAEKVVEPPDTIFLHRAFCIYLNLY